MVVRRPLCRRDLKCANLRAQIKLKKIYRWFALQRKLYYVQLFPRRKPSIHLLAHFFFVDTALPVPLIFFILLAFICARKFTLRFLIHVTICRSDHLAHSHRSIYRTIYTLRFAGLISLLYWYFRIRNRILFTAASFFRALIFVIYTFGPNRAVKSELAFAAVGVHL